MTIAFVALLRANLFCYARFSDPIIIAGREM